MRWSAVLAAGLAACSYDLQGAGRAPDPPDDVTQVALVTLDVTGAMVRASALFPRGETNPFSEPIAAQPDGVRERLVGFTDAQLSTCFELAELPADEDVLQLAPSPVLEMPQAAWAAEGTWAGEAIDFDVVEDTTAYTRPALGNGYDACLAYDRTITRHTTTATQSVQFVLQPPDRPPLVFVGSGDGYALDLDSYTLTKVVESPTRFIGGHVDDDGVVWLMRRNGALGYLDGQMQFQVTDRNGPWESQRRVWADGVGAGDDLELWTLTSSATMYHYVGGTWRELFQEDVIPSIGRLLAADVHHVREEGATYVGMDSRAFIYRIEDGVPSSTPVGEGPLGPPIAFTPTRRYGLVAATKSGGLVRQIDRETWAIALQADAGRRTPWVFDFDYGVVLGATVGFFRYWVEGLDNCMLDRIADSEIDEVIRVGNRVVSFETAKPVTIVVAEIDAHPLGCNVGVGELQDD